MNDSPIHRMDSGRSWMDFGRSVARKLAGPWRAAPRHMAPQHPDGGVFVEHPDGRRILLYCRAREGRLYAHGVLPLGRHPATDTHHVISIRADRGPAALAADITRRLLPAYTDAFTVALTHLREEEARTRARTERVRELTAVLGEGAHIAPASSGDRTTIEWYWTLPQAHEVRLLGNGTRAELTLGALPFPLVRTICDLLVRHERASLAEQAHEGPQGSAR